MKRLEEKRGLAGRPHEILVCIYFFVCPRIGNQAKYLNSDFIAEKIPSLVTVFDRENSELLCPLIRCFSPQRNLFLKSNEIVGFGNNLYQGNSLIPDFTTIKRFDLYVYRPCLVISWKTRNLLFKKHYYNTKIFTDDR